MTDSLNQSTEHRPGPQETGKSAGRSHIFDVVEAFGVISTFIIALVTGDSLGGRVVVALSACAAVLVIFLCWQVVRKRQRNEPWLIRAVLHGAAVIVLMISAGFIHSAGPEAKQSPPASAGQAPATGIEPFLEKDGYVLRRSSSIATNDQDKIDLDTGCPGWGGMHPRLGPSRCGELAELILDQEGIHTAENRPLLIELEQDSAANYESCIAALGAKPARNLSQIEVDSLQANDRICVETDLENIALVQINDVSTDTLGELERLTMSFVVWRP
jgi:hypothetical protein